MSRSPVEIAHRWPDDITWNGREAVEVALRYGCYCGRYAQLVKRTVGVGTTSIRLQCIVCGDGIGNAFPKAEHPGWQEYPLWDEEITSNFRARERAKVTAGRANRQTAYAEFLRTPEWRALRRMVIKRAHGMCESCLERTAEEVHHKTYSLGWLPPAWCLVAVCVKCHDRLSDGEDDWGGKDDSDRRRGDNSKPPSE